MIANGCIMALQCHTGKCPTGVTINVRQGLFALAAACGLDSPHKFTRDHIVFKDVDG